jgi:hypothetical protein
MRRHYRPVTSSVNLIATNSMALNQHKILHFLLPTQNFALKHMVLRFIAVFAIVDLTPKNSLTNLKNLLYLCVGLQFRIHFQVWVNIPFSRQIVNMFHHR